MSNSGVIKVVESAKSPKLEVFIAGKIIYTAIFPAMFDDGGESESHRFSSMG